MMWQIQFEADEAKGNHVAPSRSNVGHSSDDEEEQEGQETGHQQAITGVVQEDQIARYFVFR